MSRANDEELKVAVSRGPRSIALLLLQRRGVILASAYALRMRAYGWGWIVTIDSAAERYLMSAAGGNWTITPLGGSR